MRVKLHLRSVSSSNSANAVIIRFELLLVSSAMAKVNLLCLLELFKNYVTKYLVFDYTLVLISTAYCAK